MAKLIAQSSCIAGDMQTFCWTQSSASPLATAAAARNNCPNVQVPFGESAPSSCSAVCPVSYAVHTTLTTSSRIAYMCTPTTTAAAVVLPPPSPPPSPPPEISPAPTPAPSPAPTPAPLLITSVISSGGKKTTVVVKDFEPQPSSASRGRSSVVLYVALLLLLCTCVSRYSDPAGLD